MSRTRISTTVDADRLAAARAMFDGPDSQLIDRALEVLLRRLSVERERAALIAQPYAADPDLAWVTEVSSAALDDYDGRIPDHVLRMAADRRARYETEGPT